MAEPHSRQELLRRGWYVASELEIAFAGLSGRAHDLLIILKHIQGSDASAFPRRERLAAIMDVSVRTVSDLLSELRRKGAITTRRTGRSSHYAATYARATVSELRTLMLTSAVEIPDDLRPADVQDLCLSDVQDPRSSLLYKEPPTKNPLPDRLSGGSDGENPVRQPAAQRDEFDPVEALGMQNAQEALSGLSDSPEGLFPAQEVTPARTARQTATRSQAQLDTPMALAVHLDQQLRHAGYAGPAPVNRAALARNISAWKKDGLTADQIRDMIRQYVADPGGRNVTRAPWIDFINRRHQLLAATSRAAEAVAVETHRDADEDYWLGTMAGGR